MSDDDRQVFGAGRPPRPLGLDTDPLQTPAAPGTARKPAPKTKTVELNLVADFANDFGDLAAEVQAIKNGRWGPTIDDFTAIAGKAALTCASFAAFGAAILLTAPGKERPTQSVRRINLFTHSNPDLIAFTGTVTPLSIGVDVQLHVASALNDAALKTWTAPGFYLEDPKSNKRYSLDAIRARFTGPDAEIWLYACHSGVDTALIEEIVKTFRATVIGFRDAIAYCPQFTERPPSINRKRIAVKDCTSPTSDFHALTAGMVKKAP